MNTHMVTDHITRYQAGTWRPESRDDIPGSTTEHTTIVLAIDRPGLLPRGHDSLTAYQQRLDDEQRQIVDRHHGWA